MIDMKKSSQSFPWFNTDGQVASLMREQDWSTCAVGDPETWSEQLLTIVGLILHSRSPAAVIWGEQLTTFYNDAYAAQLGEKHPGSFGESFSSLWAEIWAEMAPVIEDAMAGQSFYFEDVPYTVEPGSIPTQRWYTSSFSPVTDKSGKVVGIYVTASETTRRMLSERRYAFQSEIAERLRHLTATDEIAFAASELLGKYLGVERVVYAIADESGETVCTQRDWTDGRLESMAGVVLHLDDFGPAMADAVRAGHALVTADVTRDERSAAYADAYTAKGIRSLVAVPLMKAGRLRAILNVHDSRSHYWTEHDIALAQDMIDWTWAAVENAQSQVELRTERDQSQYIFDSMTEGFAVLDSNWKVLRMNAEGLRITQRTVHEVIGKCYGEVWPELRNDKVETMYRKVTKTGKASIVEIPYTFPDHSKGWVELRAYPSLNDGLAFFFRDITERKTAQEKLYEADRHKDEFLAMLAHELRNPLAPISAAAQLLQLGKLDEPRVRQTSQLIGRQVNHMTRLVDDLLDMSRVARGLVKLNYTPLDIRHIVADAVEQAMPLIRSRRHHFALHLPPDSTIVEGDEKRLIQVIVNLLNNAAKYTNEGGNIVLKVEVHEAHIVIELADNGIGMAPELVARAFDLFAQAERTSDRSSGGLGLGLALVRSLTELHHGTVKCESPGLGKGSRFTVCLPRLIKETIQDSPTDAGSHMPQGTAPLRVMVVDDNVDAAAMLAMLLEASGHSVIIEHESRSALERARKEVPQVCLLDIGLPEMDGIELARRLRTQPETANALLIAVTGYGQEQDRKQTLVAGFDHHLIKPIDFPKLTALLAEVNSA